MPELPEVETVVRGLRPLVEGRRIASCRRASPLMARSDGGSFRRRLAGRRFLRIERRGKWMFFRLDGGDTLAIHLGMTGRLTIEPSTRPPTPHTHLRLALEAGARELRLADPRRFGELLLCGPEAWERRFGDGRLGPDAADVSVGDLRAAACRTRRAIKAVLLDQRAVAGVGNIYADEILFDARIHPARRACDLSERDLARLRGAMRRVLRRAVLARGSTIRDYANADGRPGEFQLRHRVYGRAGSPCRRCGAPVELSRAVVSGRATHFCPACQL